MKDIRKTEIKVGATVVIGVLALIFVFSWAKNYRIYADQKNVLVKVESAAGLEKGDPVTVNGVRKGFVDDIQISGNDAILKLVIDPDVNLKKDAVFAVTMLDLMGGKKVEIKPGLAGEDINYNEMQKGIFHADIPEVMAMLGSVQDDLVNIIRNIDSSLTSMTKIVNDEDFNVKVKQSISNLAEISSKLNLMIDENRTNFKELTKNTATLTKDASEFMRDNKEQIKSTLNEIESVMQSTNQLMAKLNTLADETKDKKNNLGKLIYDEKLVDNLQTSLEQVKELTKILLDQLKADGINIDANIDVW